MAYWQYCGAGEKAQQMEALATKAAGLSSALGPKWWWCADASKSSSDLYVCTHTHTSHAELKFLNKDIGMKVEQLILWAYWLWYDSFSGVQSPRTEHSVSSESIGVSLELILIYEDVLEIPRN